MVLAAVAFLALAQMYPNRGPSQEPSSATAGSKAEGQWRGLHIMSPGRDGLPLLKRAVAEKLGPWGSMHSSWRSTTISFSGRTPS